MGNEPSSLVDEKTPPAVLEARSMQAVAKYIQEKRVRRVVTMVCFSCSHGWDPERKLTGRR